MEHYTSQNSAAPVRLRDNFQNYLNYMRLKGLTEKSIKEHSRFLYGALSHARVLPDKRISELKLTDVANVIESGKRHGEYGSQRAVVTLRRYLKYLQEDGVKLPFDWRDIEVPKVPQKEPVYLTEKELKKLLRSVMSNSHAKYFARVRMRTLLEILFATGMRISEALSLTREQFNIAKKTKEAVIRGKGGDERTVYFTDRAIRWVNRYLKTRRDDCSALFANEFGNPLKVVTAKSDLLRHREEWGMNKTIRFHTFRRTTATFLIEHGADLKSTQYLMGHKSERTTLRYYVGVNKRRAKKIHQKILRI